MGWLLEIPELEWWKSGEFENEKDRGVLRGGGTVTKQFAFLSDPPLRMILTFKTHLFSADFICYFNANDIF